MPYLKVGATANRSVSHRPPQLPTNLHDLLLTQLIEVGAAAISGG